MSFDAHANLALSTLTNNPGFAGTTLKVTTGQGSLFPTPPFNCTVWPANTQPISTNAEIVRVTGITGDTFTISRAQEGTTSMPLAAGYQIANTASAKVFTDIEAAITAGGLTWSAVPASASAAGTAGNIAYDGSYFYVCVALNTWCRASLNTWT